MLYSIYVVFAGHYRKTCENSHQKRRILVRNIRYSVRSGSSSKKGSLNKSFLSAEKNTPSRASQMTRTSSLDERRSRVRTTLNMSDSPPCLPVIVEEGEVQKNTQWGKSQGFEYGSFKSHPLVAQPPLNEGGQMEVFHAPDPAGIYPNLNDVSFCSCSIDLNKEESNTLMKFLKCLCCF